MTKVERMYKAIEQNREAISNGGSLFLYNKRNEEISKFITKEETNGM
tara:strand:- start:77 stop:217 length:141 start_codon:yes stop_codon:yes gene_type:complete